ncbi:MAG: hypothetical protein LUH19_04910 [Lachnospiraceae bacterium]|nr:hypothetical protein [Lachnospiraceae bacterium]
MYFTLPRQYDILYPERKTERRKQKLQGFAEAQPNQTRKKGIPKGETENVEENESDPGKIL